jgi:hypothetical protein
MQFMVVFTAALAMLMSAGPLSAMSNYKWEYRPLLVFAESETN